MPIDEVPLYWRHSLSERLKRVNLECPPVTDLRRTQTITLAPDWKVRPKVTERVCIFSFSVSFELLWFILIIVFRHTACLYKHTNLLLQQTLRQAQIHRLADSYTQLLTLTQLPLHSLMGIHSSKSLVCLNTHSFIYSFIHLLAVYIIDLSHCCLPWLASQRKYLLFKGCSFIYQKPNYQYQLCLIFQKLLKNKHSEILYILYKWENCWHTVRI